MTKESPNKKKYCGFFSPRYIVSFLFHLDVDTKICLESEYVYLRIYNLD